MKRIEHIKNKLIMLFAALFVNVYAFAQEAAEVNISKTTTSSSSTNWYAQPWIWIVAGAVFILLFAAIMRSGSSRSDA
jgi:hypothetical protein